MYKSAEQEWSFINQFLCTYLALKCLIYACDVIYQILKHDLHISKYFNKEITGSELSDMLTSDDRKEVDLHLQRGSIARGIFRDIL